MGGTKMKLKKLSAVLVLASFALSACARTPAERDKQMARNAEILAEMGLPTFKSGIQIVPRSQLGMPDEILKEGKEEAKQREALGYAEKNVPYVAELLAMKKTAPHEIKLMASNQNDGTTHMRKSVHDLKLAFKFPGTEQSRMLSYDGRMNTLGAAPKGSYNKDKGWSGAAQFFSYKDIGVCSYAVMNVKASGTAAMLAMEDVTYDINNKATLTKVDGSTNSGFLYKIEWFDDNNFHELECASSQYSKQINHDVIELARTTDKL